MIYNVIFLVNLSFCAVVLGRVVKGTIVLVEAGTVPQDCVQKCRDALLAVGANLLGAVLTDYDPKKI